MSKEVGKTSRSQHPTWLGRHRFEHWQVDNQVYFITSTVRDHFRAFQSEEAKQVFWDRFEHYAKTFTFTPWVTSLLDTHYHSIGYLKIGDNLPTLMQRLHGSVAKLVNDVLPARYPDFWRTDAGKEYFDGCIRNEKQARLAYRYTLLQAERARLVTDWREYPHTRVNVERERAIRRANEVKAFLDGVPYKRYEYPDRL